MIATSKINRNDIYQSGMPQRKDYVTVLLNLK